MEKNTRSVCNRHPPSTWSIRLCQ